MARRSRVTKGGQRKSKSVKTKIRKPKAIKNPQSEQLLRCMDWIKSQRKEQTSRKKSSTKASINCEPEITENFDKLPSSIDSLAILKTVNHKELHKGINYACEWKVCKEEFENYDDLFNHISSHINNLESKNDNYQCLWDLCKFSTQCNSEITRHIYYHSYHTQLKTLGENTAQRANIPRCTIDSKNRNVIPELKNNFLCRWNNCSRSFLSMTLFCGHVNNHCISIDQIVKATKKRNSKLPCEWENCDMKFINKYRLVEHVRRHTMEKIVGCYHCGALFKTNTIFLDHCKRQPANNTHEYQCAQCFKYFASERLLRHHVLTHVNCFKCSMCDMTCNSAYSLARHVRYRHLSYRPFECTNCDKSFVSKSDLDHHVQTIHKNKVFKCAEAGCDYVAKSLFKLKRHDAEVHANSKIIYACHCCDNQYKTGAKLSKHLISFHKFQLPSGHQRFLYRMDEDGLYRLQTMRIESLEVTKQILSPRTSKADYFEDSCSEFSESNKNFNENNTPYKVVAIQDIGSDQFVFEYKDYTNDGQSIDDYEKE